MTMIEESPISCRGRNKGKRQKLLEPGPRVNQWTRELQRACPVGVGALEELQLVLKTPPTEKEGETSQLFLLPSHLFSPTEKSEDITCSSWLVSDVE